MITALQSALSDSLASVLLSTNIDGVSPASWENTATTLSFTATAFSLSSPSVIVDLGGTQQAPLTYNAAGLFGASLQAVVAPQVISGSAANDTVAVNQKAAIAASTAATTTLTTTDTASATPQTPTSSSPVAVITAPPVATTSTLAIPAQTVPATLVAVPATPATTVSIPATAATPVTETAAAVIPTALDSAVFVQNNIEWNPSYADMASALYVTAMIHRSQQASGGTMANPPGSLQPIAAVRPVAAVTADRNGPAEDLRNGMVM